MKLSWMISPQQITVIQRLMNTAADPMSLARPESMCRSAPIRSTTASIAEFSSSTTSTNRQLPISNARSTPVCPTQRAAGTRKMHSTSSWRNAASFFQVARIPAMEYNAAFQMRRRPPAWLLFAMQTSLQRRLSVPAGCSHCQSDPVTEGSVAKPSRSVARIPPCKQTR